MLCPEMRHKYCVAEDGAISLFQTNHKNQIIAGSCSNDSLQNLRGRVMCSLQFFPNSTHRI